MQSFRPLRPLTTAIALALSASVSAQGGASTAASPVGVNTLFMVSAPSPFAVGCDGVAASGTLYENSEVEPWVAINPRNPNNIIGVWQQDRWSTGGAHGLMSGASFDGGKTWTRTPLPFSRCGGGTAANGGNYGRASDPWVSFGPTGIAHTISISFEGALSAVLASRSLDGGKTWSAPATLILDSAGAFNDKESITADPAKPNYVYAVWDRLPTTGGGPAMFARSTNAGVSWLKARSINNPGASGQTIGNQIVVLPNGTVVDMFTQINGDGTSEARIVRSFDQGLHWSASIKIADLQAVGATDPQNGAAVRDGSDLPEIAVGKTGELFVVWADGRFSGGTHDGIALSHSSNSGTTWTAPVQINGDTTVEAFEPSVHVRSDGSINVTYFDFRNNTAAASLLTNVWLTRSTDARTWTEAAVAGPFDLETAPTAEGLFVGDYQGLSSYYNVSEPFFVQTNTNNTANRTDVFSDPATSPPAMFNLMTGAPQVIARPAAPYVMTAAFRKRVADNLERVLERREGEGRETAGKSKGEATTER